MFKIINWDNDKVIGEYEDESKAKRECRKHGCKWVSGEFLPIAFVTDGQKVFGRWSLYYNPRFKSPKASQVVNYDEIRKTN